MRFRCWSAGTLTWTAVLLSSIVCCYAPATAGSDNSSRTWAGDYEGGSLPDGTFVALQYFGYAHADAFIDSTGHELPNSHANIFYEFTRFAYIGQLGDHPLVIEGEIPLATLTAVNIPGTNNLVSGGALGPRDSLDLFFHR
jgi:hypothetical protein